jgi:hypothetical protein
MGVENVMAEARSFVTAKSAAARIKIEKMSL